MSDNGLTTDTAPPPEAVEAEVPDQAVYSRGQMEDARKEAARYRVEAKEAGERAARYEQVFGQYEPADQEAWLNLATTWAQDPTQAATIMQQIATGVLADMNPDQTPAQQQAVAEAMETVPDEGLTPEKVKEIVEASFQTREQAASEQRAVDAVMAEVRAQGYDPDSVEGFMVLWNANRETGGDIAKAAEMIKTYRQGIIDEYVQGRSSGRVALPTGSGVQATSIGEPITNLEQARKATEAFLKERQGAR